MAQTIAYFILPFVRVPDGDFLQLGVEEAPDVAKAKHRAFNLVDTMRGTDKIVGTVTFSRAGDLETGNFEDALIIDRYGETPITIERL